MFTLKLSLHSYVLKIVVPRNICAQLHPEDITVDHMLMLRTSGRPICQRKVCVCLSSMERNLKLLQNIILNCDWLTGQRIALIDS